MINLDERPEKWAMSSEQSAPYGIQLCRFSAMNGWNLSLENSNQMGCFFRNGIGKGIKATWFLVDGNGERAGGVMIVSLSAPKKFCAV